MYVAGHFKETDLEKIKDFITSHSFATLVSMHHGRRIAAHIPIELVTNARDEPILVGHVARANQIWRSFASDQEVLTIFTGPHTYVSSTWYNHVNVPTWNYIAVHVYGKPKIVSDEELYNTLRNLMGKNESGSPQPARVEALPKDFVKEQMKRIVGFEIAIDKMEANYKLSQNRELEDYENVIRELKERGDENSEGIAAEMTKLKRSLFSSGSHA